MLVELYDNQWAILSDMSPEHEDIIWEQFSVYNPATIQFIDPKACRWDGVYRFYNRAKKRLARPLLSTLKRVCREHQIPLRLLDRRPVDPYPPIDPEQIDEHFLPGITLEDYQVHGIRQACKIECGILHYPTGAGKTEILAGICKAIPCSTIVLANQRVVLDQCKQRLELRDVADEVGLFYAGRRPNGELVVVGSVQSLIAPAKPPATPQRTQKDTEATWRRKCKNHELRQKAWKTRQANARMLQQLVKKAHMLIVDECDLCTSKYYKQVFRFLFKGRRRYGLSGTPFDKDKQVQNWQVRAHLGGVIATETKDKIEQLGRIIELEYYMLLVPGDPYESSAYDIAFKEHVVQSRWFWNMVAGICKKYPQDGTLILVDKEELGVNLNAHLAQHGIEAPFIYGKTTPQKRKEALRRFQIREVRVLIGGKIINRGLDLQSGCENLIIGTGGQLQSDFMQKLGRAVRLNTRGKSRVFDCYFRCNKYLYAHSRARLRTVVQALNYKAHLVYPGGTIDGAQLIKSRFHIPAAILHSLPPVSRAGS